MSQHKIPHPAHDPYAAFRVRSFRNYALGNFIARVGMQMLTVVVGWELYEQTNSATALGLVGLFEVVPVLLLMIPAGGLIDRVDRRILLIIDHILLAFSSTSLALASVWASNVPDTPLLAAANAKLQTLALAIGDQSPTFAAPHIPIIFALIFVNGIIRSVNQPARHSILPQLVSADRFPNAVTWNSSMFETATVMGPMLGGGLVALLLHFFPGALFAYAAVYATTTICHLIQILCLFNVTLLPLQKETERFSIRSMFAGVRFVLRTRMILATITLDMLAVLLGGAVALLPIVARDVLHVGPLGLGALRSAPSLGAVTMALLIAHRRPMQRAGRNLLLAVCAFGLATIGFGLSDSFLLSLIFLFLVGMADNISVVVRHTLVQVLTPNRLRGRVSAVNAVFIACSNELGALESGLTAAFFGGLLGSAALGATASIVAGGCGTLLVVAFVSRLFPELRRIGSLEEVASAFSLQNPVDSVDEGQTQVLR